MIQEIISFIKPSTGNRIRVYRADYVKAKTRELREFGYESLTSEEVDKAVSSVIAGRAETVIEVLVDADKVQASK